MGVAQRTYSDYESGSLHIPLEGILALVEHFDASMDDISGAGSAKKGFWQERNNLFCSLALT